MPFQVVAGPIFHEAFQEIEFDDNTALARVKMPLAMRWLFVALIVAHGLIHLMGFAKWALADQ